MNKNYNLSNDNQSLSFSHSTDGESFTECKTFNHSNSKKPSWVLGLMLLFTMLASLISNAQVATNGGSGLSGTYPDLASAITALNAATITSPVIITLTGNETAPAGGYSISAEGTAVNTIIIQGVTSTITAAAPQTVGNLNDAIFKLVGADWVTIQGFTMLENPANILNVAATNDMTEWGVALLYTTATNGAQNNTIQNNTIDLDRTYSNTFGIYSNSTHALATPLTTASATGATGGNHNLKIYGNTITDVNIGIVAVGAIAAADHSDGLDVGGASLATGNIITNFGTTGTFSTYSNVATNSVGIVVKNTKNFNVSYNTVTSSNGGTTQGALRGIFVNSFNNAPTGTITNSINNNVISLVSGSTSLIAPIENAATTANATTTLNINNNDFNNINHAVAASTAVTLINNSAVALTTNINGNTFSNLSVSTTGGFVFITNSVTRPANAICNVNNNTIVGSFTKTGAGGTITFYTSNGTTPSSGLENNLNNNFSNINVTGATTIAGWGSTDGATGTPFGPTKNVSNNTFSNIVGGTSAITILSVSYSNGVGVNNVSNNTISNVTNGGAITGITSATATQNLFGNTINGLTTTGGAIVSALSVTGGTIQNVYKNKIYNIEANNAGGSVNGILVSGGTTVSVYNNIVGDLRTPSSNLANPLNGINITGGTTVNAYYNSVYLNGSSSGALFGSSAISASSTPTVALRNNIFVNNSTVSGAGLAAAYRRSSTTLTSYAAASNNNLFYATTIFTDGTNTDVTLGAFKTRVSARDTNSITENPTFLSIVGSNIDFLHINPATPTQIESSAATIATFTDDFDGNVRNVTTPDIGADEFAGIYADLTAPAIAHTQISNTCTGGNRTVSATITDVSGISAGVGLPSLYWRINAGAYNLSVGSDMGAGVYNFSIGTGTVLGDVITYYFVAQDNAGTPNLSALPSAGAAGFSANPPAVSTPPTTPFTYSVVSPMNGVYTVGTAGAYTTLTAAVADYNSRCLTGAVTFSLIDAAYAGETFPIVIQQNADASAVNTLTIKPAAGVISTISGSNATAIIKSNGADYVTIEGSNNGSTSRDLTLVNTNVAGSTIVWVASIDATNGALNNAFKNINLAGNTPTTTIGGILVSGATLGAAAESPNNNLSITNNTFTKMQNGIFAIGNATTTDLGWTITNNSFGSTVAADKLGFRGIAVQNAQGFVISGNQITGVVTASTSTSSGILVGGVATNGLVFNNNISDVKNTNTTGYGSNGIYLNSTSLTANMNVYNNFIYNVASYGYASGAAVSDNGYGIFVGNGAGYGIYHNTVAMNTNQTVSGIPAAFNVAVAVTTAGAINLRNNIFVNSQTQAGQRYAIYSAAPNTVFAAIDYNDYTTTGTNLGFIGSNRANLAAIQTGFGQNTASVNIVPVFTSATNLHLDTAGNPTLDNLGTSIAAVTADIDGDLRSATPDLGADEFTYLSVSQFDSNGFKAYPNPVSTILNIEYTNDLTNVSVYNMLGQEVFTKKITATSTQIDMSRFNAGTYIVKVEAGSASKTLRVIKK